MIIGGIPATSIPEQSSLSSSPKLISVVSGLVRLVGAAALAKWFGFVLLEATGDGVTDDYSTIQDVIDANPGRLIIGDRSKNYKIATGLVIQEEGTVLDLQGAILTVDFASGWGVTIGDGSNVLSYLGIVNARIVAARSDATLNGIRYRKNVRHFVTPEKLNISRFKGTGLQFDELNWSLQQFDGVRVVDCGVNLVIDNNGNSATIQGIALDNADTYNAKILGCVGVTFSGGFNQNAGTAGVLLDTGTVGSVQECAAISFFGHYMEANGVSHIVANDGRGLVVEGCQMNCDGMTGPAIDLNNWDGATVSGNTPSNLSTGVQRDFVDADANCTGIDVGHQHVTTVLDCQVCVTGGSVTGLIGAAKNSYASLPAASLINKGGILLYKPAAGTEPNRSRPWMCMDTAAATRAFVRLATEPRKQAAAGQASPYTPSFASIDTHDITVPNTGLTINAPTGDYADGDLLVFLLKQNGTGGGNITWDAAYATDLSNAGNAANTYASASFRWSAGRSRWVQIGKLAWTA